MIDFHCHIDLYNDPYQINIANPASLSHLRAVSFDIGVNIRLAQISDGTTTQGIESGYLDYVSIALPLINKVNEIDMRVIPLRIVLGANLEMFSKSFTLNFNLSSIIGIPYFPSAVLVIVFALTNLAKW